MPVLDTTAMIDFGRSAASKRGQRVRALATSLTRAGHELYVTRVTDAELWVGVERAVDRYDELRRVQDALDVTEMLELTSSASHRYGRIKADLQGIGRTTGDLNMLIAAIALVHDLPVVTRNPRHFMPVDGLEVIAY